MKSTFSAEVFGKAAAIVRIPLRHNRDMSPQPLSARHSLLLLALTGCCSALLTMGLASLSGYLNHYFLAPGLSFGLLIPLYFALYERASSAWRFLAFLLASIAAFEASMCAAFLIRILLPGNMNDPVTGPSLFVCGLVGGFIVLMAGSILFGRSQDNPAVLRVFAASLPAGVLGVAGWYVGRVILCLKTIPGSPVPPVNNFWQMNGPEFISLYIVWQTGTALLLGWLVTGVRAPSAPGSQPLTEAPLRPHASRTKIAIAGLFFCAVFGFLVWFVIYNVRVERFVARSEQESKSVAARRDQVFQQYIGETPPLDGLPPIQTLGAEQALILEDIAGFRPEHPNTVGSCSQFTSTVPQPPCFIYEVIYSLPNQPAPPPSSGGVLWFPARINVRVTQYPNAAWARHKGRGYAAVLDNPQSVTVSSATRTDHVMRTTSENGAGKQASYVWPSGSIVVSVGGSAASLTDDFLRQYLAKYPSSL
jgi:hypothetical protein